jgi:SAM-dependent methyltransferase
MSEKVTFSQSYYQTAYQNYSRQNPENKIAWYRSVIENELTNIQTPKVCDLGCAYGRVVLSLDPSWKVYGFDVSYDAIKKALASAPKRLFGLADSSDIPLHPNSIDMITAFDVLEHVQDLNRCAQQINQVLAPGRFFLFSVPVYDGPLGLIVRLLDKDVTHIHKKSRSFWLSWVTKHFQLLDWYGIIRYLLPWKLYIHIHGKFIRNFSSALLIMAQKQ